MQYYIILLVLFNPLVDQALEEEEPESTTPSPREIVAHSRASLETLFHLFYRRHGFACSQFLLIHILSYLGFSSVRRLARADLPLAAREASRATLVLSAKGLHDQGHNFYLAEAILCMLRDAMSAEDVHLLPQGAKVNEHERRAVMIRQVHGDWPVYVADITQDRDSQRLDRLVLTYSNQSAEEVSESSSSLGTDNGRQQCR